MEPGGTRPIKIVEWALLVVVGLYGLSSLWGLPQYGTKLVNASHQTASEEAATESEPPSQHQADKEEHAAAGPHGTEQRPMAAPPLWMIAPFVLLLGAIAVLPLIPITEHWWDHNLNRFIVALTLGSATLAYYAFLHPAPIYCK